MRDLPPTPKQIEIMQLLSEGHKAVDIAKMLYISDTTLRTHIQDVMFRLGTHTRAHMIAVALRRGWIR